MLSRKKLSVETSSKEIQPNEHSNLKPALPEFHKESEHFRLIQ